MSRIKIIFWLLIAGLTAFWVAADPVVFGQHPFAQIRIAGSLRPVPTATLPWKRA